jgi:hypothetical protein
MLKDLKKLANQKDSVYSGLIKCLQISARIINGDNVPKKYDSLLEDDNSDASSASTDSIPEADIEIPINIKENNS